MRAGTRIIPPIVLRTTRRLRKSRSLPRLTRVQTQVCRAQASALCSNRGLPRKNLSHLAERSFWCIWGDKACARGAMTGAEKGKHGGRRDESPEEGPPAGSRVPGHGSLTALNFLRGSLLHHDQSPVTWAKATGRISCCFPCLVMNPRVPASPLTQTRDSRFHPRGIF